MATKLAKFEQFLKALGGLLTSILMLWLVIGLYRSCSSSSTSSAQPDAKATIAVNSEADMKKAISGTWCVNDQDQGAILKFVISSDGTQYQEYLKGTTEDHWPKKPNHSGAIKYGHARYADSGTIYYKAIVGPDMLTVDAGGSAENAITGLTAWSNINPSIIYGIADHNCSQYASN